MQKIMEIHGMAGNIDNNRFFYITKDHLIERQQKLGIFWIRGQFSVPNYNLILLRMIFLSEYHS